MEGGHYGLTLRTAWGANPSLKTCATHQKLKRGAAIVSGRKAFPGHRVALGAFIGYSRATYDRVSSYPDRPEAQFGSKVNRVPCGVGWDFWRSSQPKRGTTKGSPFLSRADPDQGAGERETPSGKRA